MARKGGYNQGNIGKDDVTRTHKANKAEKIKEMQ